MRSMTGYGSGAASADGRELRVEIKTVNHRFLDINARYPRSLMFLEDELKKTIAEFVERGHAEVSITYKNQREDSKAVTVDKALVKQYESAFNEIVQMGYENNISAWEVSRLPDVLNITEQDEDKQAVRELLISAVKQACEALNATRVTEGEKIGEDLKLKLSNIKSYAEKIEAYSKNAPARRYELLTKRLEELLGDNRIDQQRLAQELAIYVEKVAIDEELVRLDTHIKNMLEYMQSNEAVGRKLDFFIQELNREVNTIGSKCSDADIAKLVVSAKGEIEKLREQIQNIE